MTATTDRILRTSSDSFPQPPRLCLKPVGEPPGLLDGAWWPHSRDLVREIPALAKVLDLQWGRITRVAVNPLHWPVIPRKVPVTGHVVKVGWFTTELDPHKLLLLSGHIGRWDLLVIPPETDPATARRLMSAAVDPRRCATASALIDAEEGRRDDAALWDPLAEWVDEGGAFIHLPETTSPPPDRTIGVG